MLEIKSNNGEITVRTGKGQYLADQLNELRQACAAALGSMAVDFGMSPEKMMGGFLIMLMDDDDWKPTLQMLADFDIKES